MKNVRKMLIAATGDTTGEAIKLAKSQHCYATILKVLPTYEGDVDLVGFGNIDDIINSEKDASIPEADMLSREEHRRFNTRVVYGDTATKIVEVADEENCDLIVMGTRKMNWFKRLMGGDLVHKVINNSTCPVLVVK
ncbi:MAG: universal stress protein [Nitrospirae bacterium]|nr:universal stress protein [Nitrospirota bacterium]MBF0590476.1 universal stress protein [Nitrospirota bacterium]